jgi:chemotaxis protein methyltransferase CheR
VVDISTEELKEFLESVNFIYGYDFSDYSEASMKRRISHFMNLKSINSLSGLGRLLFKDESSFEEFIQEFSVTVTEMFRDPEFYKSLRLKVMKRLATYPYIKIWVAGCATGEEVYSLAILLTEENLYERSIIYATDINQRSLQIARDGVYPIDKMKLYTSNYRQSGGEKPFSEYFKAHYGSVLFDKSLRRHIVFAPHNLATDKSFNEFQMIVCRNVLIYFNQALQNKAIHLFYDSLCQFGILGLGNKESLLFTDIRQNFEELDRKQKIFIKNS